MKRKPPTYLEWLNQYISPTGFSVDRDWGRYRFFPRLGAKFFQIGGCYLGDKKQADAYAMGLVDGFNKAQGIAPEEDR